MLRVVNWKVYLVNCGIFLCYGKCNFWDLSFFSLYYHAFDLDFRARVLFRFSSL